MKSGQVIDVMLHLPQEKQGIYLIYPLGRFTQPKVCAFINFLVGAFSGKGPDGW